jgi:hypothetical protein
MELGNQQERLEGDRHWLGGIVDGEGCVDLGLSPGHRGRLYLHPEIHIANTDPGMVQEIVRIYQAHNIAHHVKWRSKPGQKDFAQIRISGLKRVQRFLDAFQPYIRSKQNQAQAVRDFIESRLTKRPKQPYDQQEADAWWSLRVARGSQVSSETKRLALQKQLG